MAFHIRWPTQFNLITQVFGARPEFYGKFGLPGHEGVDFQAPEGTELHAVADGVVSEVRPDGDSDPVGKPYGNQVRLQHDEGYTSIYAHLAQIIAQKGQAVKAGQLIGLAGNTGNSFGAHLHLTIKKVGATQAGETRFPYDIIDPTPYVGAFEEGARPAQPEPPAQPPLTVQVNSPEVGYLNVRRTPSTSGALVVKAPNGTTLGALEADGVARGKVGQKNQWLWVRAPDGQIGYAAAWYLRLQDEAAVSFALPVSFGISAVEAMPVEEERKLVQTDDLTRIRGIGPKTAVALRAAGIGIYEQLASFKPNPLAAWLKARNIRGRHASTWPKQAQLIVAGRWKALATLQKKSGEEQ